MLPKTFALLHRALRSDVRLLRTHLFRSGLLAFVLYTLYDTQWSSRTGSPGLEFFDWLQNYNLWFVTVSSMLFFSTAITEEKEEQTLGLLRLAGISPLALLLGKWSPRLIGALLLISIQFPFTLLAITLGGILVHQAVAAYFTLAAHLVLCGSVGLFASVVCARSGSAATLAGLLLLGLLVLLPVFDRFALLLSGLGLMPSGWVEPGARPGAALAFQRLEEITRTGFNGAAIGFQVVSNLVVAAGFAGASWLLFDRCTRQETAALGASNRWMTYLTRLGRRRSHRAWVFPLVWKDFYQIAGGGWTLIKLAGYPVVLLVSILLLENGSLPPTLNDFGPYVLSLMLVALLIETSVLAARVFREETKRRTWPLLVLLPRGLLEVSYAKLAGAALGLAPALFYFGCGAVLKPQVLVALFEFLAQPDLLLLFTYLVCQIILFWHFTALLSIVWTWAAWPVAVFFSGVFVIVGNVMLFACLEATAGPPPVPAEVLLTVLCGMAFSLVFAVHVWIGHTLERLAGE